MNARTTLRSLSLSSLSLSSLAPNSLPLGSLALTLALGCGTAETAETPVAPTAEAPVVAPTGEAPTAETPPVAEVPVTPPTLAELITTTTPVVPTPAPQSTGPLALTATICTLDGPPIIGDDSFRSIGPVAWSSDGALYLLDNDARLRRYTVAPGDGCSLTLDTTMGDGGRLNLGEGLGSRPEGVVADANGHVYVSSSMHGTDRITGTTVDYHCETMGTVSVSPNGRDGIVNWSSGPAKHITFTDSGCAVEDWNATDIFPRVDSASFIDATHVLVGGHAEDSSAPHLVRIYDISGRPQGDAFGDTTGEMNADDHFCHVHSAVACGDRTCVLDGNCRSLRVFDRSRAVVGEINITDLVGVTYAWFPGMSSVRDHMAYLTVNQQRGSGYPRPDIYDTFVVRVSGF